MPFLTKEELAQRSLYDPNVDVRNQPVPIETPNDTSIVDLALAARRQESGGAMLINHYSDKPTFNPVDNYDFFSDITGTPYEAYATKFVESESPEQTVSIKRKIDNEIKDQQILEAAGAKGLVTSIAVGMFDPTDPLTWAGFAPILKGGKVMYNFSRVGAANVAAQALTEGIAHGTMATRTGEQSAANIATAGVLGGSIGAAVGKFTKPKISTPSSEAPSLSGHIRAAREMFASPDPEQAKVIFYSKFDGDVDTLIEAVERKTGIQIDDPTILADAVHVDFKGSIAAKVEGMTDNVITEVVDPIQAQRASKVEQLRAAMLKDDDIIESQSHSQPRDDSMLVEEAPLRNPPNNEYIHLSDPDADFKLQNSLTGGKGIITPNARLATARIKEVRQVGQMLLDNHYLTEDFPKGVKRRLSVETIKDDFNGLYAKAIDSTKQAYADLRKKGTTISYKEFKHMVSTGLRTGQSTIPEVGAAMKPWRHMHETVKERAQAAGMLDDQLDGSTYLKRMWDTEAIVKDRQNLKSQLIKDIRNSGQHQRPLNNAELSKEADNIIDNMLGGVSSSHGSPSAFKSRKLDFIDEGDYTNWLVNDVEEVGKSYLRNTAPRIAMMEQFGTLDLRGSQWEKLIQDSYQQAINKAEHTGDQALAVDLRKEMVARMQDLLTAQDHILGMKGTELNVGERVLRQVRNALFMSKMGWVQTWQLTDFAGILKEHPAIKPFINTIWHHATNKNLRKLSNQEMRNLGVAVELEINARTQGMYDVLDGKNYNKNTFEKGMDSMVETFSKYSGISQITSYQKNIAGMLASNEYLTLMPSYASLTEKQITTLADIGIDGALAQRISAQFDQFGTTVDGFKIAQTDKWTDTEAALAFGRSIRKDVENAIITPTIGQKPYMFSNTELGKTVAQFKTFTFAAHEVNTIRSLQRRDASTLQFVLVNMSLAGLVVSLREYANGRDPRKMDVNTWMYNAFDRSAVAPLVMDLVNTQNKMMPKTSIPKALGVGHIDRYYSRGSWASILGPSAGVMDDVMMTMNGKNSPSKAFDYIPGQNHVGVQLLNAALGDPRQDIEDHFDSMFGVKQ